MATMGFSRDGKNTFAFSGEQMCRSWYVYWRRGYMITDAAEARTFITMLIVPTNRRICQGRNRREQYMNRWGTIWNPKDEVGKEMFLFKQKKGEKK